MEPIEEAGEYRVTRVSFQARDQSRVNVFVNGRFAFAISATQAVERGLKPGRLLEKDDLVDLRDLEELERARGSAMALLARRPRSERELRDRLTRKGVPGVVADRVLRELKQRGYVDDAAFAEFWVANRRANQPRGRQALVNELRLKGVASEVIDVAVAPAADDEERTALELARRRARSLSADDPQRFRARLGAFLQRKGYRYEVARSVVDRMLRERRDGATEDGDESDQEA